MTFASMNFLCKSELRRAVIAGQPVVLFNPEHQLPAINGTARVVGPWPRTAAPVEEITDKHGKKKQRERIAGWHADVKVRDMRIVEVLN